MSDKKPNAVEIIADDFSGGIDAMPETIVMTKKKRYRVKPRSGAGSRPN